MRIWYYKLLPYLPDLQFRGQLRELILIMHELRDKGKTNHLLINKVMQYPKENLRAYFILYCNCYINRYGKTISEKYLIEFNEFAPDYIKKKIINSDDNMFEGWHDKEYLRICMANLYEKHLGEGKSRISDDEWKRLCKGYKKITDDNYFI